jgi:hypothetical protein
MRIPMIRFRYGKRPFGTPLESISSKLTIVLTSGMSSLTAPKSPSVVNAPQTFKPSKMSFLKDLKRKPLSALEMSVVDVIHLKGLISRMVGLIELN